MSKKNGEETEKAAAKKRSEAARKAVRTRWAKTPNKRYEQLGISKTALRRYELPKSHRDWRPMPPEVRERYEKLKKKGV